MNIYRFLIFQAIVIGLSIYSGHNLKKTETDYVIVYETKEIEVAKEIEEEEIDEIKEAIKYIARRLNTNPLFIEAQLRLESGHYTNWRAKDNHNLGGLGVYNNDTVGGVYDCYMHFAVRYIYWINRNFREVNGTETIDEFLSALQDKEKPYADDKKYKDKVKDTYRSLGGIT